MENIELLENEYFVPIKGYEGLYEISNMGRVKTLPKKVRNGLKNKDSVPFTTRKEALMKCNTKAYGSLNLYKDNKYKLHVIRELMMLHFTNFVPKDGYRVINIDGNYENNALSNLKVTKNIRWREIVPMVRKGMSLEDLSKEYGFSVQELLAIAPKKSQLGVLAKYTEDNSTYFERIDNEKKAYWLGFLYADGNVTDRCLQLCISKTDLKHLTAFRDEINPKRPIREYLSKYSPIPLSSIAITNRKIVEDLNKLGMVQRKTFTLEKLPEMPKELIRHFIRGYFDGDGCLSISKHKKSASYLGFTFSILGNKPFLEEIQQYLIESCDLTKTNIALCKPKKNQITCQYVKGGNPQVYKILTHLYEDSTVYLDRKYEKFLLLKDKVENHTKTKLTPKTIQEIIEYHKNIGTIPFHKRKETYIKIGKVFKLAWNTIADIINKNKKSIKNG